MESLAAVETNTLSQQVLEYALNTDGLDTSDTTGVSYLQYRADTDAVASWLATTARKCGFPVDLLTSSPKCQTHQQQSSQRLKGKTRKQARATADDTGVTLSTPGAFKLPTFTIAAKEFVSLAAYVAAATR
ncbi:hypothetical protein GX48_03930 [Paracoccidioides brasiliensis]|nr:hypothetical protein GX48_03930 [Paracoccidioides brasiliensis]